MWSAPVWTFIESSRRKATSVIPDSSAWRAAPPRNHG